VTSEAPDDRPALLSLEGVDVAYGSFQVLWDVSLRVAEGEIVALMGPNGAGKSTILNTAGGVIQPLKGVIAFAGQRLERVPAHRRVDAGLTLVLERHRLFPRLTVRENLLLGAYRGDARKQREETLRRLQSLFPIIGPRANQEARTLSGGEQQMVAIARGLMSRPRLLMIDEPTLGLSPKLVGEVIDLLRRLNNEEGITILFVEQNVELALSVANRGYILESGRVLINGSPDELLRSAEVKRVFLGIA
jgi:branched-chain amino acid transport system ATP-binding protein